MTGDFRNKKMLMKVFLGLIMWTVQFSVLNSQQIETFLTNQAQSIREKDLSLDVHVKQKVDKRNNISTYTYLYGSLFLEANEDQSNRKIIIVPKDKDPIDTIYAKTGLQKRYWTVLMKQEDETDATYYVLKAAFRPKADNDDDTTSISSNGQQFSLEWLIFHSNQTSEFGRFCISSLITPCILNLTVIPDDAVEHVNIPLEEYDSRQFEKIPKRDYYYPLLYDLEPGGRIWGRSISSGVATLTGSVLDVACGVLGVAFSMLGSSACVKPQRGAPLNFPPEYYDDNFGEPNHSYDAFMGTASAQGENSAGSGMPISSGTNTHGQHPTYDYNQYNRPGFRNRAVRSAEHMGPSGSNQVSNLNKQLNYAGWKTQFINPQKGVVAKEKVEAPYYGFGNCPFTEASKSSDLADYYLQILRVDCLRWVAPHIRNLVDINLLIENSQEKLFTLNLEHKLIHKPKLAMTEETDLVASFQMAVFSKLYHHLDGNNVEEKIRQTTPGGQYQLSKSIAFTIALGEEMIKTLMKVPKHRVFLLRNMIFLFTRILNKVNEDLTIIGYKCHDCQDDVKIMQNDKRVLLAYIIYLTRAQDGKDNNFDTFFNQYGSISFQ